MSDRGNLILENREKLCVSAVTDVESFDDKRIVLRVGEDRLTITGEGLKLNQVSVEQGEATVVGLVDSCTYSRAARGSLWGRLTK